MNETKKCKYCKTDIDKTAKICPNCNKKLGIKVWQILLIVVGAFLLLGAMGSNSNNNPGSANSGSSSTKVTVVDFSTMTKDQITAWATENKVTCNFSEEYSDTIEKGAFVKQNVAKDKTIYQKGSVTIVYSLGKEPSVEFKNALKKAENYSKSLHMSKNRIYAQLTSEYGEKFPAEAAQYAVDNMKADWNANALAKAKSYQESMSMSTTRIYDQLVSEHGEGFTAEQAQYAIDNLNK